MIVYHLRCAADHEFEGWFADSASFDAQAASGKLDCPFCDSRRIEKAPMAPAVAGARKVALTSVEAAKMRRFMTGLRKYVEQNAEYVGADFAEEARKIHYGETGERHIYGEATLAEASDLVEEGIDVAPPPPGLGDTN